MDLLGLLLGSDLAGSDGPDGFVGNDNVLPVLLLDGGGNGLELALDDIVGDVLLALLEGLTDTSDDLEARVEGRLDLVSYELVRVAEERAALRVAEDDPWDAGVLDLLGGDFTSEGARLLAVRVLGRDLDGLLDVTGDVEEVQGGGRNDDLCVLVLRAR